MRIQRVWITLFTCIVLAYKRNIASSIENSSGIDTKAKPQSATPLSSLSNPSHGGGSTPTTPTTPSTQTVDKKNNPPEGVKLYLDKEKTTDNYEYSEQGKTKTYTAKDGFGFNRVWLLENLIHVGRRDRKIWDATNPKDHKEYANKVINTDLGLGKRTVTIYLFNGKTVSFYRPAWGSAWDAAGSSRYYTKTQSLSKTEHHSGITIVTGDGSKQKGREAALNDFSKFDLYKILCGSDTVAYNYVFKDGVKCTQMKFDDKTVWEHEPKTHRDQYPESVSFHPLTKSLFVALKDLLCVFRVISGEWKQVFVGKFQLLQLDIEKKEDSKGYDYFKSDSETNIFISMPGFCFGVVKEVVEIWRAVGNECANRVIVTGSSQKSLKIRLISGHVKLFKKDGGSSSKSWSEGYPLDPVKHTVLNKHEPASIKIFTDNNSVENDITKYSIRAYYHTGGAKYGEKECTGYRYYFEPESRCVEIKYSDKSVWKHDASHGEFYPYLLIYKKTARTIEVCLTEDWFYKFKLGQEYKTIEEVVPKPLDLDLNSSKNADGFYSCKNDNTKKSLFLPKQGWTFKSVGRGGKDIWKASDDSQYSDLILVRNINETKMEVSVNSVDGSIKRFEVDGSGEATEIKGQKS